MKGCVGSLSSKFSVARILLNFPQKLLFTTASTAPNEPSLRDVMNKLNNMEEKLNKTKADLARNNNVVSSLLEFVSRAKIRNQLGSEFSKYFMVRSIPDLLHFVHKSGYLTEEVREHFLTTAINPLEQMIEKFIGDLAARGQYKGSPLFESGKECPDICTKLSEIKVGLERQKRSNRKALEVVEQLEKYFPATPANRHKLLRSARGPGLALFIWSVGKRSNKVWFQPNLEFDCEGQILKAKLRSKGDSEIDHFTVSVGEIKTTLNKAAKDKAEGQLTMRLMVIKEVLAMAISANSFTLRGFCFFLKNGGSRDTLIMSKSVLTEDIEVKFVKLGSYGDESMEDETDDDVEPDGNEGNF